ncbi:MAG: peptidase M20, partial [Phenylobacterium sp.]|nr:peptidase M20 [Phenylobacterium sp.]
VIVIGAAVIAVALSLAPGLAARSTWGGWTGLIGLILVLGGAAQALAPEAAFLFVWTGLLAAVAAGLAAFLDPGLARAPALAPAAVAAVLGAGWIMGLAHTVFLGVGMDLPGVLVLLGLLVLMLVRPLSPEQGLSRPLLIAAATALILGAGLSVAAQVLEPMVAASTA